MLFIPSVTLSALVTLTPATVMVDDVLSVTRTSAAPTELRDSERPGQTRQLCRGAGDCHTLLAPQPSDHVRAREGVVSALR